MTYATTDLSDAHPDSQICEPVFRDFGGKVAFHGLIKTLKVFEDNAQVRAVLETQGQARVLVVDGGGSTRCALFGGNLGELAVNNNWAGVVVYGLIRDCEEIAQQAFGLKALGTCPRKSEKGLHLAHEDRILHFAGARFAPGAWLYADADGILLSDQAIHG
ncbi:MAG: ribonuclease E activity regulator RraA [Panacagrimonas sp.]